MARILVVEDDMDLSFLYKTILTQNEHDVTVATSTATAIEALEATQYDLVFLDLNMPDAQGIKVIDHAQASLRYHKLPIVIITANDHWLDDVYERGIEHVLVKPISIQEIIRVAATLTS